MSQTSTTVQLTCLEPYLRKVRLRRDRVSDLNRYPFALPAVVKPRAAIYELGPRGPRSVRYEETEHFRVTRDFLNRYPMMVQTLLKRDDSSE